MSGAVKGTLERAGAHRAKSRLGPLAMLMGAALLSGCAAKRDSVIVGSVPDDYRTNHPIVVSEREQSIDLPVARSAIGMTEDQRETLAGFLTRYDRETGGRVTVLVPAGSTNERAASRVAEDFAGFLQRRGVPRARIAINAYRAPFSDFAAPIRISYPVMKASAGPCGKWPEDLADTTDNKHYANFGCSYQNNLAAQVANPLDFLGPRKPSEIDAENRDAAITDYKDRIVSEEFADRSEVIYNHHE